MPRTELTGSRIRAVRTDKAMRQAELARRCDISASYLNLIEHNRRRIGGALLNRLASELGVDPSLLSEGAESGLTTAIERAAMRHPAARVETERAEEFAGRYPGWARLIEAQSRETLRLERVIEGLTDRLTHDPFLSASLHDVLSSVTAIRSASSILADGGEIAPEWQARFHRNIFEDSRRLAESAEQLVSYLDAGADIKRGMSLPGEDVEVWRENIAWRVPELEADPDAEPEDIVAGAAGLDTPAARQLALDWLETYAADLREVPTGALTEALAETGLDPAALARRFSVPLPIVFRRLASLPDDAFPGGQSLGLVACDGSGTLTFRKPVDGFELPRYGAACPLWPLFQALQRPMQPIRQSLRTTGRDTRHFTAWAIAEATYPGGFEAPGLIEAWMLIEPRPGVSEEERAHDVGTSCRICARPRCPARREPALVSETTIADRAGA